LLYANGFSTVNSLRALNENQLESLFTSLNITAQSYKDASDDNEIKKEILAQINIRRIAFDSFSISLGHQSLLKSLILFVRGKKVF
jgi:hypothetical protein